MEMTTCPDSDRLTTLEQAADWDLSRLVQHLSSCGDCQDALRDLESLRSELTAEAAPRTGFAAGVMDSLAVTASDVPDRRIRRPSAADLVNIGLAGLTATVAIAIASAGSPADVSAAAIVAGGLVAAACYSLGEVFGA